MENKEFFARRVDSLPGVFFSGVVVVLLWVTSVSMAAPVQEITFDDMSFRHAWENPEGLPTSEYVEEGATLENWEHLLAYRRYPGRDKPAEMVNWYLKQIKPTQKPAMYQRAEKRRDVMLVFMILAPDKSYVEFNIHRFVLEDGMVRSYQFAARNYKRSLTELSQEIKEKKARWMECVWQLRAIDFEQKEP